uniref:Uncharacterized protein n=1 Tax=Caenorhabditis japonica TaxID=281687 RepID=A0A8R1HVB4_CAEJA
MMWQTRPSFRVFHKEMIEELMEKCINIEIDPADFEMPVFTKPCAMFSCFKMQYHTDSPDRVAINMDQLPWYRKKKSEPEIKPRRHRTVLNDGRVFHVFNCVSPTFTFFKKYVVTSPGVDKFFVVYLSTKPIKNYIKFHKPQKMSESLVKEVRSALDGRSISDALKLLAETNSDVTMRQVRNQARNVDTLIRTYQRPGSRKSRLKIKVEALEVKPQITSTTTPLTSRLKDLWSTRMEQSCDHSFFVKKGPNSDNYVEVKLSVTDRLTCTQRYCKNKLPNICDHVTAVLSQLPSDRKENVIAWLHLEGSSTSEQEPDLVDLTESRSTDKGHGRKFKKKFGFRDMTELTDSRVNEEEMETKPTNTGIAPPTPVKEEEPEESDVLDNFMSRLASPRRRKPTVVSDFCYN